MKISYGMSALGIAISAIGCSGGGGFSSHLDASATPSAMTGPDRVVLCDAITDHVVGVVTQEKLDRIAALVQSLQASITVAECEDNFAIYQSLGPYPLFLEGCSETFLISCSSATVAEIEDVVDHLVGQLGEAAEELSCDLVAEPEKADAITRWDEGLPPDLADAYACMFGN
jgi:hypothetical protein